MHIFSINTGKRHKLDRGGFNDFTGIHKRPLPGPIEIGELGLRGDHIADTKHHGGPDQAVYVYRREDYEFWSDKLGRELTAGVFGDNLTVMGVPTADFMIGSRLLFRRVILEVTAPRIPCITLAAQMNDPRFVKRFLKEARLGAYCRVLETGSLEVGDEFDLAAHNGEQVTIHEMADALSRKPTPQEIDLFLSLPIDSRNREHFEKQRS